MLITVTVQRQHCGNLMGNCEKAMMLVIAIGPQESVNIEMLTLSCGPIAIINVMVFSQFPIIFLQGCPCTVTVINIMAFHGPHQIPAVLPLHYYCFTAVKVICQHLDVDTFLGSYYRTPTLAPCISSPAVGCFSLLQLLTSPCRHSVPQHYD